MFTWKTAIMLDSGVFFLSKLRLGEDSGFRINYIFFPLKFEKAKKYVTVSAFPVLFVFLLDEPSQGFGFNSCLSFP